MHVPIGASCVTCDGLRNNRRRNRRSPTGPIWRSGTVNAYTYRVATRALFNNGAVLQHSFPLDFARHQPTVINLGLPCVERRPDFDLSPTWYRVSNHSLAPLATNFSVPRTTQVSRATHSLRVSFTCLLVPTTLLLSTRYRSRPTLSSSLHNHVRGPIYRRRQLPERGDVNGLGDGHRCPSSGHGLLPVSQQCSGKHAKCTSTH